MTTHLNIGDLVAILEGAAAPAAAAVVVVSDMPRLSATTTAPHFLGISPGMPGNSAPACICSCTFSCICTNMFFDCSR